MILIRRNIVEKLKINSNRQAKQLTENHQKDIWRFNITRLLSFWHLMINDKINNNRITAKYICTVSDGVPIGSGTFATILGGITIWNPWSNESDANLEGSACTVRMLLFFSIVWDKASFISYTDIFYLFKTSVLRDWERCKNRHLFHTLI